MEKGFKLIKPVENEDKGSFIAIREDNVASSDGYLYIPYDLVKSTIDSTNEVQMITLTNAKGEEIDVPRYKKISQFTDKEMRALFEDIYVSGKVIKELEHDIRIYGRYKKYDMIIEREEDVVFTEDSDKEYVDLYTEMTTSLNKVKEKAKEMKMKILFEEFVELVAPAYIDMKYNDPRYGCIAIPISIEDSDSYDAAKKCKCNH